MLSRASDSDALAGRPIKVDVFSTCSNIISALPLLALLTNYFVWVRCVCARQEDMVLVWGPTGSACTNPWVVHSYIPAAPSPCVIRYMNNVLSENFSKYQNESLGAVLTASYS